MWNQLYFEINHFSEHCIIIPPIIVLLTAVHVWWKNWDKYENTFFSFILIIHITHSQLFIGIAIFMAVWKLFSLSFFTAAVAWYEMMNVGYQKIHNFFRKPLHFICFSQLKEKNLYTNNILYFELKSSKDIGFENPNDFL